MSSKIVKKIIATFLKTDPGSISSSTRIDNTAISGSVLIHRMYSELSKKGFKVTDISKIKSYGDLESFLFDDHSKNKIDKTSNDQDLNIFTENDGSGIGIDVESSDNLPDSDDYFEDQFYLDNFSKNEIAYCSSKKDPRLCFCGRFAAKEAIVKADNRYLNTNFSDLEIKVSSSGAPVFKGMHISISHVNIKDISFSTAIAKKNEIWSHIININLLGAKN